MRIAGVLGFLLLVGFGLPAMAATPASGTPAELYRYVNSKGVVVLDRQGVPPEYIDKGYEVLSEQGRVVRVVPPAPSAEERQRLSKEKAQASSDAQLLRLYSSVDDIDRARERKLTELDGVISAAKGNLLSLRTQQANLQSRAAEIERAGNPVPENLLVQINNLSAEQAALLKDIARYDDTRKQTDAAFMADRTRLSHLLGARP